VSCRDVPTVQLGGRAVLLTFEFVEEDDGLEVPVSLAGAAALPGYVFAQFRKPSGAVVREFLQVLVPATAGLAAYSTAAGWLDEVGEWEAQAFAHLASGAGAGFFPSRVVRFEVLGNLPGVSFPGLLAPSAAELEALAPEVERV